MKRAAVFELVLPLRDSGKSANRWLYESLRGEILEGRLRPGTRLPATRDLARQYGLARGTIVNAFEQLESEGYIEGSVGSGTYVNKVLPDELLQVPPNGSRTPVAPYKRRRRVSDYARRVKLFPNFEIRPSLAFRANMPALDLFPTTLWAQVASRRLRRASANLLLGCGPLGYPPLRDAVATYLSTSRGVKCVADQVVIVSGVQEAVDLATRLLVNPGDRVCMENPGYPGAAIAFKAAGAKVSALDVDGEGMRVQEASMRGARWFTSHRAPVSTRGHNECRPASAVAGLGGKVRGADPRRRLRQRISLFGTSGAGAARTRSPRTGAICWKLQQGPVSLSEGGISGCPT
jgi:GntR family transcriptional regulator / MocR family aminotransferase